MESPVVEEPVVKKPEKPKGISGILVNEGIMSIFRLIAAMGIAAILGYSIAYQSILSANGTIAVSFIVVFGVMLGAALLWLLNRKHIAFVQRKLMGKNLGQAKVLTASGAPISYIVDYNNELNECGGGQYLTQSPEVRPCTEDWLPTLYYRQGVAAPLPWDIVAQKYENRKMDATAINGAIIKIGSLLEGGGVIKVAKSLKTWQILCFIAAALAAVLAGYDAYMLSQINTGLAAVYYNQVALNGTINAIAAHTAGVLTVGH